MTDALPLAVTMGDPAGCGPQITARAWQDRVALGLPPFYLVGRSDAVAGLAPLVPIGNPSEAGHVFSRALPVFDPGAAGPPIRAGQPERDHAPAITAAIRVAVEQVQAGQAGAVITNPIAKKVLYDAGFPHPGHTEYLAELARPAGGDMPRPVMMLVGGGLRVALATIHLSLRDAISAITPPLLVETARIVHASLVRDFGLASPRIAFTGLNPHAGEEGSLGREEIEVINPAAAALRAEGLAVSDARPADTVFAESLAGNYDAVIAMTHDQGLIPVKTLDLWGGVNTTLGLPFVRTSPDHGTAFDAAAAGTARPDSLVAAIRLAASMSGARARNV